MANKLIYLFEAIFGVVASGSAVFSLISKENRTVALIVMIFAVLAAIFIYLGTELKENKNKIKELERRIGLKELVNNLDKSYKDTFHNVDKRLAVLESEQKWAKKKK